MSGRFIVLEGIDGCGKTTQLLNLSRWLPKSGLMPKGARLHLTREPGGTALGVALRDLLLSPPEEEAPQPLAELMLYAADRAQHVSQLIQPLLNKGDWVLSDRFSGSTVAYQGYGRQLDIDVINELERIATGGLVPDLTFLLDLSVKESLLRRGEIVNDRIEAEGAEFLARVSLGFSDLANQRGWTVIPADPEPNVVTNFLKKELLQSFVDI